MVYKLKSILKDLENSGASFQKKCYEMANGEDSHENYLNSLQEYIANFWFEMITLRPELSSK